SGPWVTMDGGMAAPPPLAGAAYDHVGQPYLRLIKMTHNYHFNSNHPGTPEAYLEVRLQDGEGRDLKTVRVPDPGANAWVRQRQLLLTRWLTDDVPVMPPQGERIYAPGQEPPTVPVWEPVENRKLTLRSVPEMELPRNRPVFRPSEWSLLL